MVDNAAAEGHKKPSWTDAQRRAIEVRDANVLVAASAGTGKTAVLVERCIGLVTDAQHPIDIDRLLVVTFTEAAAAEVRNRVAAALRQGIAADPADTRLRRQLILLDRASISTIHAFALRTLQEHFFRIGLDPNLAVMDPEEADLIRHETLDEVFEGLYADEGEAGRRFRRLVGRYGRDGDDQPVRRVVVALADFFSSLPAPESWRASVLAAYPREGDTRPFEQLRWFEPFRAALENDLLRLVAGARTPAGGKLGSVSLPAPYVEHFEAVAEAFESFRQRFATDGYDALRQAVADYDCPTFPTVRGIDTDLRERVKSRYSSLRTFFRNRIQGTWCALTGERWVETLRATRPDIETLFDVVERFDAAYTQAKRERGEVDFQDLERFCFELLLDREPPGQEAGDERREAPSEKLEPVARGNRQSDSAGTSAPPARNPRSETQNPNTDIELLPSVAAREIRDRYEAVLVDEYQDISPIQDAILHLCSRQADPERARNLFMVGDVKQSIYRFRLAEPSIFREKFDRYRPGEPSAGEQRVDLRENFRSRGPLLSALNSLFRLIMVPEVGGIRYDEEAELRGGYGFPPETPPDLPPPWGGVPIEVHFFDREKPDGPAGESESGDAAGQESAADPTEELEQIVVEARWVADRIHAMVDGRAFSVRDRRDETYRPVAYRDIAVLLQTAAYKADLFVREMRARGVSAYTEAAGGSLTATEMLDLFSLLEMLDNPYQDIAVAAVLRSPLVGLGEDDLARIRIHDRKGDFFSAVAAYAARGRKKALRARLSAFLEQVQRWRSLARRGPLAQALWAIYDETGYLDYVTAMEDGAQRRANLIGLYDRARQFDEFSRRGLGRFLEFIRRLQKTEGELGAPSALSEAEDVVRVMSIHKSKGLEFPVVFVPDIGKKFNLESTQGDLVIDRAHGVAVRAVDPERAIKYPTAAHLVVAGQERREILAENLRLLYVALTRARERLILCGSVRLKDARQSWLQHAAPAAGKDDPLDPVTIASGVRFADWIGPALARLGCLGEEPAESGEPAPPFAVEFDGDESRIDDGLTRRRRRDPETKLRADVAAMKPVRSSPAAREAIASLTRRLAWRYPWQPLTEIRGKTSVTELKRRFDAGHEADETAREQLAGLAAKRPKFVATRPGERLALSPAEVGTLYHTILRHMDFTAVSTEMTIAWQIEMMVARGIVSVAEAESLDLAPIAKFLRSPLGLEMKRRPAKVRREMPFSLAVRADEIEAGLWGRTVEDEWIHVQGVIDCLIERHSGLAIVDFKTDRIGPEEVAARAERYRLQLHLYARAVETILHRPVIEMSLYFLRPAVAYSLGMPELRSQRFDTESDD